MQKKLIALAVAGAMTVPAVAMAEAEFYGKVRVSAGWVSDSNEGDDLDDSSLNVSSHKSRLGFKGSEDLGGDLKAVWQYETQIEFDEDPGSFASKTRNTFIGLAGGFGTVVLGRHDTPYKIATTKLDMFKDTHGDYTGAVVDDSHDARLDNVIAYISPDMNGLQFLGAYSTDVTGDDLPDTDADIKNDAISLAVTYTAGDLFLSGAYQIVNDASATVTYDGNALLNDDGEAEDTTGIKLGASYKLGATKLNLIYELVDYGDLVIGTDNVSYEQDNIYFAVSHMMGDTELRLALGQKGEIDDIDDSSANYIALGVFQHMSKTTELYAMYAQVDAEADASNISIGKAVAGAGLDSFTGASDEDGEATSAALVVGINHKFSSM